MKWILVNERLPEDNRWVLVSMRVLDFGNPIAMGYIPWIFQGRFDCARGWEIPFHAQYVRVDAWMEIPYAIEESE
jgi:hypothetical protein